MTKYLRRMKYCLLLWLSSFIVSVASLSANLEIIYDSNQLDIDKNLSKTIFNPENVVPLDIDATRDGRTFMAVISKKNVRYSLLTLSDDPSFEKPVLQPYPNSSWHAESADDQNCEKLRAVSSIKVDICNRLWVVDNGRVDGVQECPPKLVSINLRENSCIEICEIPKYVAENADGESYLVNPVIHTNQSDCGSFTVFIADTKGHGLISFDGATFKRLLSNEFKPRFKVPVEDDFIPRSGIFPLEIGPKGLHVYFAPYASRSLHATNALCLMSGKRLKNTGARRVFDSQPTVIRHCLKNFVVFIGLSNNKLLCWNKRKVLCMDDFAVLGDDPNQLHNITSIKIVEDSMSREENVVILAHSSKSNGNVDFTVLRGAVKQLIQGTVCETPKNDDKCPRRRTIGKIANLIDC